MLLRRFLVMLCIMSVSLLGSAACTPVIEGEAGAAMPASATETASNQESSKGEGVLVDTTPTSEAELTAQPPGQSEPGSTGEGVMVDITPMSEEELAAQPPGQSEPGAGAGNGESQVEPGAQGEELQPGTIAVYTDSTYKFSVSYPADFVVRTQPAEELAQLTPMPTTSFTFMNPVTASSDVVELEPADLEIRVYDAGQIGSLDSWLTSNGLLPADSAVPLKPFQTANVSGVEVCATTMIAPGCSYFVLGSDWVYQLTPATLEGETMVDTFMLIP